MKLSPDYIQKSIAALTGWALNANGEIEKTFVLSSFSQALLFVNAVGLLAEAAQHHPDIDVRWNKIRLGLTTHDSGGLTQKDIDLAQRINTLPVL